MTHKTDTLAQRLRALADELESAQRYPQGPELPFAVSVTSGQYTGVSFHVDPDQFEAWADYTEATVTEYDHDGSRWQRAEADMDGLLVNFASATPIPPEVAA